MLAGVARFAFVVLVLASCKGDERGTTPVTNTAAPAPAPSAIPAGWVTISPTEERLRCANYARDEWQIAIEQGTVKVTQAARREPDSGPVPPFALPKHPSLKGRRHTLAFGGGFLVGFDAGEWGGALYWFLGDGSGQQQLAGENVRGLVALGPEAAMSIEGLAHLGMSEGAVRWIERRQGTFEAAAVTKLPDAPSTFVATGDGVYVLTTSSLVRIGRDRRVATVQPVRTSGLYPDSMAIDATGALWIGMRQFVLRLSPAGGRYTETWLAREDCRHAEQVNLDCVCRGG